jgi:hypothetical protein
MTVIQTGAIAAVAFVFGDYASQIVSLGERSSAIYAGLSVVAPHGAQFRRYAAIEDAAEGAGNDPHRQPARAAVAGISLAANLRR